MNRNLVVFSAVSVCLALSSVSASAYEKKKVHPEINEQAITQSVALEEFWGVQLGFPLGVKQPINGKKVFEWFKDGGTDEDAKLPHPRFLHHFHDPLQDWGQSGASHYLSLPLWAQSYPGIYQKNSWQHARDYYYRALTGDWTESTPGTRNFSEQMFAETFRSVGMLMHLVADASVPAHVRNDLHPVFDSYELYTEKHLKVLKSNQMFIAADLSPTIFDNPAGNSFASTMLPISALWDRDQYDGSNPGITATDAIIGLAEYTNANFYSDESVEATEAQPYPNENCVEGEWVGQRKYYRKSEGCGESGYLLVAENYYSFWGGLSGVETNSSISVLDPLVLNGYASLLVPKAVTYAKGLAEYFFRGKLALRSSVADGGDRYSIYNLSDEEMSGDFSLYYDDTSGNRHLFSTLDNMTIAAGEGVGLQDLPSPPRDASDVGEYILAFRGTLGSETDAVAGAVVKLGLLEGWGNDIKGNYPWLLADTDIVGWNVVDANGLEFGDEQVSVVDGRLIMENSRYANKVDYHANAVVLMDAEYDGQNYCAHMAYDMEYCSESDFGINLPRTVDENSWITVKVDEMTSVVGEVDQDCPWYIGGDAGEQGVIFYFDDGTNQASLAVTLPGQHPRSSWPVDLQRNGDGTLNEITFNIFDAFFENSGVRPGRPIKLTKIEIRQDLMLLCRSVSFSQQQRMVVDSLMVEQR